MTLKEKLDKLKSVSALNQITTLDLHLLNLGFELQDSNYSDFLGAGAGLYIHTPKEDNEMRYFCKTNTFYEETKVRYGVQVDLNKSIDINYFISFGYDASENYLYNYQSRIIIENNNIVKDIGKIDYDKGYRQITDYLKIILNEIDNLFKFEV